MPDLALEGALAQTLGQDLDAGPDVKHYLSKITFQADSSALEVGFRQFDCTKRYRNEEEVGEAMRDVPGSRARGARRPPQYSA